MSEGREGVGEELETVGDYTRGEDIETVKFLENIYFNHKLEKLKKSESH